MIMVGLGFSFFKSNISYMYSMLLRFRIASFTPTAKRIYLGPIDILKSNLLKNHN